MNTKRPLGKSRVDVIAQYLKAIDQNVTYESTYTREGWRDLLKAAMVRNRPVN